MSNAGDHNEVYGGTGSAAVLRLFGTSWGPCGYCKGARSHLSTQNSTNAKRKNEIDSSNSSCSYAVYAQHIEPELYERMICDGWRRSGNVIYLPKNELSCCPTYPIRLPVDAFVPSKSQRKVVKQVRNLATISNPVRSSAYGPSRDDILQRDACLDGVQTSRITRRKLQHPMTRCGLAKGRMPSMQNAKVFNDAVCQSNALKLLCKWTACSVHDVLRMMLCDANVIETIEHSLPVIQYKAKLTKRKSHTTSPCATFMSTICAAVVGKSGGLLDRGDFVNSVVLRLQTYLSTHQSQVVTSLEKPNEIDSGVIIQSIDSHPDSGQVLVSFSVDASKLHEANMGRVVLRNSESGSSSSTASSKRTMNEYSSDDPIQHWWKSMLGMEIEHSYLSDHCPAPPYEIAVTTVPAHESALNPHVHQLYWHYQHVVHGESDPRVVTSHMGTPSSVSNGVTGDKDALGEVLCDQGTFSEKIDIATIDWGQHAPPGWREAAIEMLNDKYRNCPTEKLRKLFAAFGSFYEFLVENPFPTSSKVSNSKEGKSGLPLVTYHQHYTLSGGSLVAVGVIDILPCGLSSVYLFYNPSFADSIVPMGKYSTMKEIEYTKHSVRVPYYYLGYYIHSCPKMNYKIDYKPSEILCPITKQWVNADRAKSVIETESPDHNYCSLVQTSCQDENGHGEFNVTKQINHLALELGFDEPIPFGTLDKRDQNLVRPALEEFVDVIGVSAALRCTIDLRVHERP